MTDSPSPLPAAAVLLVRDGALGIEVLMIERPAAIGFAGGALAFPGGKVDAGDFRDGPDAAPRLAAIRELFEECAILLARRPGEDGLAGAAAVAALRAGGGRDDFHRCLAEAGLVPALDRLVPFSHWITPSDRPKRFDTRFFLVRLPEGQVATADEREVAAMGWMRPADILRRAESGERPLVVATHMNLLKLSGWNGVDAALAEAAGKPVVPIQPERIDGPSGQIIRFPAQAGFGVDRMPASLFRRS